MGATQAKWNPEHVEMVHLGQPGSMLHHFSISSKHESRPSFCTPFFAHGWGNVHELCRQSNGACSLTRFWLITRASRRLEPVIKCCLFLFTGMFSFSRFPLFTWWHLVICQKLLHRYNRFKCKAIVQGDVQGITTLIGRILGKTLTIKLRVWDLAMFTNDTQDKKDSWRW